MIFSGKLLASVAFISVVMLPASALSDVQIVLKNGRSIVAEKCEEKGEELLCSRGGGFFGIEKGDIAKIKGMPEGAASDEMVIERPADKSVSRTEKDEGVQPAVVSGNDLQRKLDDITRRKKELRKVGIKLAKDREQLKTALRKAPDWMTVKQYNELSGRLADLDKRIKGFRGEVARLNAEEKRIVDQLKARSKQSQK